MHMPHKLPDIFHTTMHACLSLYTYLRFFQGTTLPARSASRITRARMPPHINRTHIDFLIRFTIRTSRTLAQLSLSFRCLRFLIERRNEFRASISIAWLHAQARTSLRALHCIILLTRLTCTLVAYLQASHTHAHATHASRHLPYHHACIPIYILAVFPRHNSTFPVRSISFVNSRMRCACRTCIDHIYIAFLTRFTIRTNQALAQLSFSFRCLRFLIERRY